MIKNWKFPMMETVTKDELEDLLIAAGCSYYHDICSRGY